MPWTFKNLVDRNGANTIRPWLDGLPLKARLKVDQILRNLRVADRLMPPHVKKIKGHRDVLEIVVKHNKVQYRPLGGYGPMEGDFTIVLGAIEHNNNIRPPDAFATASRHVATVKTGVSRVCNHEYEKPDPGAT